MTIGDEEWMGRFATVTREEMLRHFAPDHCVLGTRIGLEVLRYFRIDARPEPVSVAAFTPDAFDAFANGRPRPATGYSVGVQGKDTITTRSGGRPGWDAHLVLLTSSPLRLVDLTADQMDRPQHDMRLPGPVVSPVLTPEQWQHGHPLPMRTSAGTWVVYEPIAATRWKRVPDWTDDDANIRAVIGRSIRTLRRWPAEQGGHRRRAATVTP